MSQGDKVRAALQRKARADGDELGKPIQTDEYLLRHTLESFLARLAQTPHASGFILKGGILLGVYGVRRPTKDVDSEAVSASVTPAHIRQVVADVAAVAADDGAEFDLTTLTVEEIREGVAYPGLRMRVAAHIGEYKGVMAWDISTGDPIVPAPKKVTIRRLLGDTFEMLGYAPETTVAEKGVTILERGITSTRWRDYIDIVELDGQGLDLDLLLDSARAVADYRKVELRPTAPSIEGYGQVGQTKWAAWRRKEKLEDVSEAQLNDQMAKVCAVLASMFRLVDRRRV